MHHSPQLREILAVVNKRSHNMYAEQVLRTVGRTALGNGSVEGGERAVQLMIERESGTAPGILSMNDGSGLSLLDRVSARTVIQLLSMMHRSPMSRATSRRCRSRASADCDAWAAAPGAGNLRAKTGTMNNVSALSGYVTAANGERLAFSIISNGVPSTWRAKRVEDQIGARLASFTRPDLPADRRADRDRARDSAARFGRRARHGAHAAAGAGDPAGDAGCARAGARGAAHARDPLR